MTPTHSLDGEVLLLPGSPPKYWSARIEAEQLIVRRWKGQGKPRETRKKPGKYEPVDNVLQEARLDALSDGYVFLRAFVDAAPGQRLIEGQFANAGVVADLDPSGGLLAATRMAWGHPAERTPEIELVEVATGERRRIPLPLHAAAGDTQVFVHGIWFEAGGNALRVAVNSAFVRIDLSTGDARALARFAPHLLNVKPDAVTVPLLSRFNPFVDRPRPDAVRGRWLVFDGGDRIKVLEHDGRVVLDRPAPPKGRALWCSALSPSGRRAAFATIPEGADPMVGDAVRHEAVHEIEIWDVDAQRMLRTLPLPRWARKIGIDPDDAHVLVRFAQQPRGPIAFDLATGTESYRMQGDDFGGVEDWAWSVDGAWRVVADRATSLQRTADGVPLPLEGYAGATSCRFSHDGRRLALMWDRAFRVFRVT